LGVGDEALRFGVGDLHLGVDLRAGGLFFVLGGANLRFRGGLCFCDQRALLYLGALFAAQRREISRVVGDVLNFQRVEDQSELGKIVLGLV
jgi:hypothetical protein